MLSCLSVVLVLGALTLNHGEIFLKGPFPIISNSHTNISLANFSCPDFDLATTAVTYDAAELNISLLSNVLVDCSFGFEVVSVSPSSSSWSSLDVLEKKTKTWGTGAGSLRLQKDQRLTITKQHNKENKKCIAQSANVSHCTLHPTLDNVTISLDGNPEPAIVDDILEWLVGTFSKTIMCDVVAQDVAKALAAPPKPAPPLNPLPNRSLPIGHDIRKMQFFEAVLNIINSIPHPVDGGTFDVNASFVSDDTARIFFRAVKDVVFASGSVFPDDYYGARRSSNNNNDKTFFNISIPAGTSVLVDLSFTKAWHDEVNNVYYLGGFSLANFRLLDGDGSFDAFANDALSQLVLDVIDNILLPGILNSTLAIPFPSGATGALGPTPKGWVIAVSVSCVSVACALVMWYVVRTYGGGENNNNNNNNDNNNNNSAVAAAAATLAAAGVVFDDAGRPVAPRRVIISSAIITISAGVLVLMFIYFCTSVYAQSWASDTLAFYNYELFGTVHSLFEAQMQAQGVVVFLFSGVIPYAKLATIVYKSVICQRPHSKALQVVDSLGKLSLIDSFLLQVLIAGLEIKGLVSVKVLPSFYIYLVATVLSIVLGNFATRGYSCEGEGEGEGGVKQQQQQTRDHQQKYIYQRRRRKKYRREYVGDGAGGGDDWTLVGSSSRASRTGTDANRQPTEKTRLIIADSFHDNNNNNSNPNSFSGAGGQQQQDDRYRQTSSVATTSRDGYDDDDDLETIATLMDANEEDEKLVLCGCDNIDYETQSVIIGVLCGIAIVGSLVLTMLFKTVSYEYVGFLPQLFVGHHQHFSLYEVFKESPTLLSFVAFTLVFFTPIALPVGYPFHISELGAWTCQDAFALALYVGLIQMEQLVETVLGPFLTKVFRVKASLNWPAYVLTASLPFAWFLVHRLIKHNNNKERIQLKSQQH